MRTHGLEPAGGMGVAGAVVVLMWRVDEIGCDPIWCATEADAVGVKLAIIAAKRAAKPEAMRHLPITGVEAWFDSAVYEATVIA